jgi:BirA family biotin operon repressor/biotin-[acetyl-CoA-carboxylase] ligase
LQNNIFSTLFVGQNLIILPEVDSTNNYLKRLVSNSEPLAEGTVIMADHQYAGRGQQGNVWHAAPGLNLTLSLLLRPVFLEVNQQFYLNMVISIALADVLCGYAGGDVKVKWPNDLYYKQQKIGGILIENTISGNRYKTCIVGIGINVNQKTFSPELSLKAISLSQILQKDVNLIGLLAEICSHIESGYLKLRAGTYLDLRETYLQRLYLLNKELSYVHNQTLKTGTITGVTDQGLLVMQSKNSEHFYTFKEIEFLNHTK